MDTHAFGAGIDPAAERELDTVVQVLGIRLRRLRNDEREATLS